MADILESTGLKSMSDAVHSWLGVPCGCQERREKLNSLHRWFKQVSRSKTEKAAEFLNNLMGG